MNKSESKYFNTAVRMDEALINLLDKKGFEYITVKEICENAEVNRSTFYLHYETIVDLLLEAMEYMNKKFMDYFESDRTSTFAKLKSADKEELIFITPDYLIPYLTFIKENRKIFVAALDKPEIYESNTKYNNLYQHLLEPILERFSYPTSKRKFVIAFYVQGIMAIIHEWIKGGCREEIIEIGDIIAELILSEKKIEIWGATDEKGVER